MHNHEGPIDEVGAIDQQIAEIMGSSSLDFIQRTLCGFWSEEVVNSFGLIEKIKLFLTLASRDKINLPKQLRDAVKEINAILPNEKFDITYLKTLGSVKRKKLLQILSSLALLFTFSFSGIKSLVASKTTNENASRIELATDYPDDSAKAEQVAQAKFERLYNHDLEGVVAEMGWNNFITEYSSLDSHEGMWSSQEVLQLLRVQEPRYWGSYILSHPSVFGSAVVESKLSLVEFMSSCGTDHFLEALKSQKAKELNWLDIWSTQEILATLKTIDPDWGRKIISNQVIFAGQATEADLSFIITSIEDNPAVLNFFLSEYQEDWDKSWTRRELLDEIKLQVFDWKELAVKNIEFWAPEMTADELSEVIAYIAFTNNQGTNIPYQQEDLNLLNGYYKLKLFRIMSPAVFARQIQQNFSGDIAAIILLERPELSDLENKTLDQLFSTEAISYILENYSVWQEIYPMSDLIDFLRAQNSYDYYYLIAPYPELFQQITLTDSEVSILVYVDAETTDYAGFQFMQHYSGEHGWEKSVPIERLIAIGRDEVNQPQLATVALKFPDIFLPHFNDDDLYKFIVSKKDTLIQRDVLESTEPIWAVILTQERRRALLEAAQNSGDESNYSYINKELDYFFKDVHTFAELQTIMENDFPPNLRKNKIWQENTTLEWEYALYKTFDEKTFATVMVDASAEFSNYLTKADLLLILKYFPKTFLDQYWLYFDKISPGEIAEFLKNTPEIDNYGAHVIENGRIFSQLFYSSLDFEEVLVNDGLDSLFAEPSGTEISNYEQWSEVISNEQLYVILKKFDAGKVEILSHPNLFFEFVRHDDLDTFTKAGTVALSQIVSNEDWSSLWTDAEIYESARKNKTEAMARVFLDSKHMDRFLQFIQHDDLDLLIGTFPNKPNSSANFRVLFPHFLKKWSIDEIMTSIKREHPENWGDYISFGDEYFGVLFTRTDLEELVRHEANPEDLFALGLWSNGELFNAYQQYQPEKLGAVVIPNAYIFDSVIAVRNISLSQLLKTGGAELFSEYQNDWDEVWTESEMQEALDEMKGWSQ